MPLRPDSSPPEAPVTSCRTAAPCSVPFSTHGTVHALCLSEPVSPRAGRRASHPFLLPLGWPTQLEEASCHGSSPPETCREGAKIQYTVQAMAVLGVHCLPLSGPCCVQVAILPDYPVQPPVVACQVTSSTLPLSVALPSAPGECLTPPAPGQSHVVHPIGHPNAFAGLQNEVQCCNEVQYYA